MEFSGDEKCDAEQLIFKTFEGCIEGIFMTSGREQRHNKHKE